MGYETATTNFTADEVDRIRAVNPRGTAAFHGPDGALMQAAVDAWRNSDEGYGDPDVNMVRTLPLTAPGTRNSAIPTDTMSFIMPLCAAEDVVRTTVKVKVTAAASEMADLRARLADGHNPERIASVRAALEQFGATVERVQVVAVPAPRKPVAKATGGKLITKYEVVQYRFWNDVRTVLASGNTMAEAKQAGIDLMAGDSTIGGLDVEAVVVRVGGAEKPLPALATISRPESNTVVTIEVTTGVPKPGAKPDRYYVGFGVHR
jgi:hypothetical protein